MSYKSYLPKIREACKLVSEFGIEIRKAIIEYPSLSGYDQKVADAHTDRILAYFLSNHRDGKIQVASRYLADAINTSRKIVRLRILNLAKFGILRVVNNWDPTSRNKKQPWTIELNPMLLQMLESKLNPKQRKDIYAHLIMMGLSRLDVDGIDLQGFEIDCPFGEVEPTAEDLGRTPAGNKLMEILEKKGVNEKLKREQQIQRRKNETKFIEGAADVWSQVQSRLGRGSGKPNWCGETKDMPQSVRRERESLTKTYGQYGGYVTGLAWYVFCCEQAELNEKGAPVFNLKAPHRQFTTLDKKPSQFAKHLNSVLKDEHFIFYGTKEWEKRKAWLDDVFGEDILKTQPYDGGLISHKIGFALGDKSVKEDSYDRP